MVYIPILGDERVSLFLNALDIRLRYKLLHSSSLDMFSSLLIFIIKPRALFRVGFLG